MDSVDVHLSLAVCRGQASTGGAKERLAPPAARPRLQSIHCCQRTHLRSTSHRDLAGIYSADQAKPSIIRGS